MTISSGVIHDETGRMHDDALKKMQARKHEKREQTLDLMMLLSALESWAFSLGKTPPDYLIERMDKAIDMLRAEVLEDVK
jgi:aspartate aminotransferase-like enzyme